MAGKSADNQAGNGGSRVLLVLMAAALALTLLVATRIWSPLPILQDIWANLTGMSDPEPRWTVRIDGRPDAVSIYESPFSPADARMMVAVRGYVEVFRTDQKQSVWKRPASWARPTRDRVVVRLRPPDPDASPEPDRGYQVIDPFDPEGRVLWRDDDAQAVWVFAANVVGLHCPDQDLCVLRNTDDQGTVLWEMPLPSRLRGVHGQNPHRPGLRSPAGWFAAAAGGVAPPLPLILPLVVDDQIYVVDTGAAQVVDRLSPPDRQTRVAFFGDRMLFARAERAPAGCRYLAEVYEVGTGTLVWQRHGYDLDTARGAGCEPREDPLGTGSRLVVNGTDARPVLVEAGGAEPFPVWTGEPGARVLATDGVLAVVVVPDRRTVNLIDVTTQEARTVWSGEFGPDPDAALVDDLLIVRDTDADRLSAWRLPTMDQVLDVRTTAEVAGAGSAAIVLRNGRTLGVFPLPLLG